MWQTQQHFVVNSVKHQSAYYSGDTFGENDDIKTCNINFDNQDFNRHERI